MKSKWDEKYGSSDYFYGTDPNTYLQLNLGLFAPNSEILCLAEGEGRNAVFLAKSGHRVTAIDFSSVGLEKLESLAKINGVEITTICQDIRDFRFERDRWDAIISIWCHLPSSLRTVVHGDVVRSLKSGGVFLLEAYTPEQLMFATGGPKDVDLLPTLHDLRRELEGLTEKFGCELRREVREGSGHRGESAVVQFLGVKL